MRVSGAESVASCAGEMAMTAKAAELAAAAGELAAPSLIHWRITSMVDCGSAGAPNGICTPTMPAPLPAHALTIVTLHRTNRRMPDTQTITPLLAGEIEP